MQQFLKMPFDITAVTFDSYGKSVPRRIDYSGRSFDLQPAATEGFYGFSYHGRYFWIERHGKNWRWIHHSTILQS